MLNPSLHTTAAAILFFWCGCVTAISFLEAWLKFRAPGVTIPIGLGIGRLVFAALNKVEWVLATGAAACLVIGGRPWSNGAGFLLAAVLVLALETIWLLPVLDRRAEARLTGKQPPASSFHFIFVAAEAAKLICLVAGGVRLLKLI